MPKHTLAYLVAVFVLVQAAFWLSLLFWHRRRLEKQRRDLWESSLTAGEVIIMEPQSALYRGAKFGYPAVRGNGIICVTNKRVLFQKLLGRRIEIPLADIVDVTEGWRYKGLQPRRSGPGLHVILHTRDRNEIGFLLRNSAGLKNVVMRINSRRAP